MKVLVIQSCPALCDPMDFSPPGSSVHGMLQARILELVAMPFSRADGKESSCNAEDLDLATGLGRAPGEWNGYPLQNSSLENSMDRGVQKAIVHGAAKSQTGLSADTHTRGWFHLLSRPLKPSPHKQ